MATMIKRLDYLVQRWLRDTDLSPEAPLYNLVSGSGHFIAYNF